MLFLMIMNVETGLKGFESLPILSLLLVCSCEEKLNPPYAHLTETKIEYLVDLAEIYINENSYQGFRSLTELAALDSPDGDVHNFSEFLVDEWGHSLILEKHGDFFTIRSFGYDGIVSDDDVVKTSDGEGVSNCLFEKDQASED